MDVELVSDLPFSGWPKFRRQVLAVDPAAAIAFVQQFTLTVAEEDEGVFRGKSPIVPTTLHVLVREWLAALSPECLPALNTFAADEICSVLLRASRELNGLRETHPALVLSPLILSGDLKLERTLRSLWFTYLEQQGLNWVPKFELGRSQRMFVEIWRDLRDSQRVKYRSTESTAFLSPPYAILMAMGVWRNQGIVSDVTV